jgi:hypothetical protein
MHPTFPSFLINPCNHSGQLESTFVHSFIRAAKLRRWLARDDCPPAIKECKCLFDKAYALKNNHAGSTNGLFSEAHDDADPVLESEIPSELQRLVTGQIRLQARCKHQGVMYSRSSTHLGNSLVLFHPNGIGSDEVPGTIKYIFETTNKEIFFAVQRHLDVPHDLPDPYEPYPYFPAKLYQSCLAEMELVKVDWVVSHFARWTMTPDVVVVLSLSKVRCRVLV